MWFPTAALSLEFFLSDFDISHNTTMQNQLKRLLGGGRASGRSGRLEGTPGTASSAGGHPSPLSSRRKTAGVYHEFADKLEHSVGGQEGDDLGADRWLGATRASAVWKGQWSVYTT